MSDLDPHLAVMLEQLRASGAPPMRAMPIDALRAVYRSMCVVPVADDGVAARDLTVAGASADRPARLYEPAGLADPGPGMLFLHGGGFIFGDLDTHDALCRRLAAVGRFRLLSVAYRLAPEHPFPAAHDDAMAAARWTLRHGATLGFAAGRIGMGGDSAGAMLTAATAIGLRDAGAEQMAFQLLAYPGVFPDEEMASMRTRSEGYMLTADDIGYFNESLFPDPALATSPGARLLEDAPLGGLPPALVVTAGYDPFRDGGRWFATRLRAAGVEVELLDFPSLIHGFGNFTHLSPGAARAIDEIAERTGSALRNGTA